MLVESKNDAEGKKVPPSVLVVRYEVLDSKEWVLKEGPMRKAIYSEAVGLIKENEERNAKRAARKATEAAAEVGGRIGGGNVQRAASGMRRMSEAEIGMTVARAVVKLQSCLRRVQARRWLMHHLQNERDTVLAMSGTIQGKNGWYEFILQGGSASASTTMVVRYEISDAGDWLLREGPFKRAVYDEALAIKQRDKQQALERQKMIDLQTPEVHRRQMVFAEKRKAEKKRMLEQVKDRKKQRHSAKKDGKSREGKRERKRRSKKAKDGELQNEAEEEKAEEQPRENAA
jgi:hypothetical protein